MADQVFQASCGFFDAVNNDRLYTADDINRPYKRIVANGVFATPEGTDNGDLLVSSANSGMNIKVNAGEGMFANKWFSLPYSITITVPINAELQPRIDSVIVQVDKRISGRVGNIVYRTGTASAAPEAPAINTVSDVIEYRIANVYVQSGASYINNTAITDLRGSSSCPWVTSLIQQVDTSTLWQQFQTAYADQFDQYTADYQEYVEQQRQAWEDFISTLTEDLTVTTSVLTLDSTYTATGTVTNIPINIASFNKDTDILQVFINGLYAAEGQKYTVNAAGTQITLTNSISAGNTVYFVVFKSVVSADFESAVSIMQRIDDKLDDFMSDSGWITLTLENGAVAVTNQTPAVRCVGNRVYLRGSFKGVTATGTTVFTLPFSFRPAKAHTFTTAALSGSTANDYVTITVYPSNGAVKISAKSGDLSSTDAISVSTSFLSSVESGVSMVFSYKGTVASYVQLPANPDVGDVYMVESAYPAENIAAGDDVMWNGAEWEIMQTVISSSEIDSIIDTIS